MTAETRVSRAILAEPCILGNFSSCPGSLSVNVELHIIIVKEVLLFLFQEVPVHLRLFHCNFRDLLIQILYRTPEWRYPDEEQPQEQWFEKHTWISTETENRRYFDAHCSGDANMDQIYYFFLTDQFFRPSFLTTSITNTNCFILLQLNWINKTKNCD